MHILLIHQAFASIQEAGGTRHYEFARQLVREGHKVTVIASPVSYLSGTSQSKTDEVLDGIQIYRSYTYQALHKSFVHRVFSFISFMVSSFIKGYQVKDVDIVWGTSPPIFQGITAFLLAKTKGAKFLFEVRDLWPDFAIAVGVLRNRTLIKASLWLEKFLYRNADQMMVNSPAYVPHVLSRGCKKVELIPNGADPDMFSGIADGSTFRKKHGLKDKFAVMYAGAHGISNDLQVVLECAQILNQHPQIVFVFVGDGKEKNNLIALATRMQLNNVIFVDAVPKNDMANTLAAADACLAILKPIEEYKTTYPNKVFDYMAAGKPVILAIDGVIREVVESANCGVFTRPGDPAQMADAVLSLRSDPQKTQLMGSNGAVYLQEHFSRSVLGAKLIQLLTNM